MLATNQRFRSKAGPRAQGNTKHNDQQGVQSGAVAVSLTASYRTELAGSVCKRWG